MRQALTISLSKKMKTEIDKYVKENGNTRSDFVREAVQEYLYYKKLRRLRDEMTLKAGKRKIYTDEDVFKRVS